MTSLKQFNNTYSVSDTSFLCLKSTRYSKPTYINRNLHKLERIPLHHEGLISALQKGPETHLDHNTKSLESIGAGQTRFTKTFNTIDSEQRSCIFM